MAATQRHVELARTLPPKLLRFFARHPPAVLRAGAASSISPSTESSATSFTVPDSPLAPRVQAGYEQPFESTQHPVTKKWHDPVYSLRRQADLSKLAATYGVSELLPFTAKSAQERRRRREEQGLRVKGTGVGQKVKGHWWERTLRVRLDARRQAMREMPALIQKWKSLGHGGKWKNWPGK